MGTWLSGIGVSRGIAIGRVQRMQGGDLEVPEYSLARDEVEHEVTRFEGAQHRAKEQLQQVKRKIPRGTPNEIAAFIETHLLMLDDRSLNDAVVALIREQKINAEAALRRQRDALVAVFEQMEDPYLRTRRDDVEHVAGRILRILMRSERQVPQRSGGADPVVLVADDLTPADIILMPQQGIAGFITEFGGPLSHSAILARSLSIPAVVGLHGARRLLQDDEAIIVDSEAGSVIASPDAGALDFFRDKQARHLESRRALVKYRDREPVSRDGARITLRANIELPEDARQAEAAGAEGVGLYRTEFLYMNRRGLPSEDEQYDAYARVISSVKGPITIRTLDLGADKQVDSGSRQGPTPNNPALGLRAIRLCLREPDLFRVQVRALLRAASLGDVHLMLPMISNVQEFRQALALIGAARDELAREGRAPDREVPVGAMIEVPAAAIAASRLARHSAFFSIGTNDLIQYTLAIDRVDDEVNYLYDPLHPAVLQLIRQTIDAGAAAGIPVAMCGEMASDPKYTRLLLGLGLTEFSMHPASVLEIKRLIIESDVSALRAQVDRLLDDADGDALRDGLDELTQAA